MRLISLIFAIGFVGMAPVTTMAKSTSHKKSKSIKISSSCGMASNYGINDGYNGRKTSNGETFNTYEKTAAHRWFPFGTKLKVTNPANHKSVVVRVNDRGPFVASRELDLSYRAFTSIASPNKGVVNVCYSQVF
jgi:rare lipoprotein A